MEMTVKRSTIYWHDAKLMSPAKDGVYLMATKYGIVSTIGYTAEGKWNTHRDTNGVLYSKDAWDNEDGYIEMWAEMPRIEEVRG